MTGMIGAPSVLEMGSPGSGKTFSIATLLKSGLEVFVIITEPNGLDSLLDAVEKLGAPMSKLHWHVVAPMSASISILKDQAQKVNTMGFEDLTKLKMGVSKRDAQQWIRLLDQLEDFECQRTGQKYGNVGSWDSSRALVIDSLTGLAIMAWDLNVGAKPMMHQGEYGVAMNMIHRLIITCTSLDCYFVLIAHIERNIDPIKGGTIITVSSLGSKLSPKLPAPFSEVVLAYREGAQFFWSTATSGVDTKNRALAVSEKLKPDFGPIVEMGKKRADLVKRSAA